MNIGSTHTRSFARRIVTPLLMAPVLVTALWTSADAQDADEMAKQQMEVMRQYMEAAGMSEEEIAKNEAMIKNSMGTIVEGQAAQEERTQAEFEAQTAGLGKATVSILGEEIEMHITRCEPLKDGDFWIEAKEGPDRRKSNLNLRGTNRYNRTEVQLLSPGIGLYEVYISPIEMPDDGRFSWTGTANGDRGPAQLTINLKCIKGL